MAPSESPEESTTGTEPPQPATSSHEGMHRVADTVGFAPNVRLKDNLIQGAVVLCFCAVGMFFGHRSEPSSQGLLFGLIAGLVFGGFFSGLCLGLVRLVMNFQKKPNA